MNKQITLSIAIVFFLGTIDFCAAQEFTVKNKMVIYSECQNLLGDYQRLVNQLSESGRAGFEGSVATSERLMELFINRKVMIYNDLDPQYQLSEYYELETYTSNMVLWYPDGINIYLDLDNARTSDIRKHDEGLYSTDIMVNKKIQGNYMNKAINSNTEELIFRIAFTGKDNTFREYRFVGVRSSKSAGFTGDKKALYALKSIELTAGEREKVQNDLRQILNDYQRSLAMLGDPNEPEEDKGFFREAFLELFPDSAVRIFNDIEEKPEKEIITVETYLDNYRNDYPEGIKNIAVNIDSADFGDIIPADDGSYYCYVYADKFFSGKFQNKGIYRSSVSLVFKIVFQKTGSLFTHFKIENIDRSGLAFLQDEGQSGEQAIPANLIQPISRKGFHVSPFVSAGYSFVVNKNIRSLDTAIQGHAWQIDPAPAYSGGINVDYFISNHTGLSLGLGYGHFSATYSLHGKFKQDTIYMHALTRIIYSKRINAMVDSTVRLSCIQIPLQLNWMSGSPQKTGIYCRAGILASLLVDGKYNYEGNLDYWGYAPELVVDSILTPEMGFYQVSSHSGRVDLNRFFLSGTVSAGIAIPLAYFTTLQIGPVFHVSLSDVSKKVHYTDVFGTRYDHKPVSLNYLGFEICIRFL